MSSLAVSSAHVISQEVKRLTRLPATRRASNNKAQNIFECSCNLILIQAEKSTNFHDYLLLLYKTFMRFHRVLLLRFHLNPILQTRLVVQRMLNARPFTQSSTKELISRSGHRFCGDVTDNTCITGLVHMYMYAVVEVEVEAITPLPLVVNGHFRFTVFNLKIVFCRTLIIYRVNVYFNNLLTSDRVPVRPLSFLYMYTLTR